MRRIITLVAILVAVGLAGTGCASNPSGPLQPWTPDTGVSCEVPTATNEFAVADSFVNSGSDPIVLNGASFANFKNFKVIGGPWIYPGQNAGFRLLAYPFGSDIEEQPIRDAWRRRATLAGITVKPKQVVFVALLVKGSEPDQTGSLGAVQVDYARSSEDLQATGAFTFEITAGKYQ